jgi:hypothetical protein
LPGEALARGPDEEARGGRQVASKLDRAYDPGVIGSGPGETWAAERYKSS